MPEPVVIVDHDPAWRDAFRVLSARIMEGMRGLPAEIEHVGSTAVPGLAAKPIIDIDLVVPSGADLPEAIRRLARLGYAHQGDLGVTGREAFLQPPGDPAHHLYLCSADSVALLEHRRFRDRLLTDPSTAHRYADLKRRVAAEFTTDRGSYTEAKSEFIREVLADSGRLGEKGRLS